MRQTMIFTRDEVSLHVRDFGGTGPPLLLLHGLAGYAGEWESSAALLVQTYRVFALDQRGHGDSERRPRDLTREAYVEDAAEAIRQIDLGPVTLVGQSMGANTAMLTTARYPDLVTRLVMIEGSPDGPEPPSSDPPIAPQIRASLSSWPVPFADEQTAHDFFESKGFEPSAWTAGLERTEGGLRSRFEIDTLVACMADLGSRSYWREWGTVQCPTLVILGEHGMFPAGHGEDIISRSPEAKLVTIPHAGHDVHLDAPNAWVQSLADSEAC
jgi:pimeloyl-ACP methyl ester carboxylesterase